MTPTSDELAAQCVALVAQTTRSVQESILAMRRARASLLGVTMAELDRIDRRAEAVVAAVKEHGLSFADAEAYVRDQERLAREQAELEVHADAKQAEEDEANEREATEQAQLAREYR